MTIVGATALTNLVNITTSQRRDIIADVKKRKEIFIKNTKRLRQVVVVQGYHYGIKKNKHGNNYPFINMRKPYHFRITNRTHNVKLAHKNQTCSVLTKQGKRFLVISKIIHARGKIAMKSAKTLQPVINFQGRGMENNLLYKIFKTQMRKKRQK